MQGSNCLKKRAKTEQDTEAELLQYENYSISSSKFSSNNNGSILKNVCLFKLRYMINNNENETEKWQKDYKETT